MKLSEILLFLSLLFVGMPIASAKDAEPAGASGPSIRHQMILMGLYIYGIETAVSQPVPDPEQITFLADSISDVIRDMQKSERGKFHHKNLDDLLKQTDEIKKISIKEPKVLRAKAQGLIDQCAKCHIVGGLPKN